jgi:hypothetical protein
MRSEQSRPTGTSQPGAPCSKQDAKPIEDVLNEVMERLANSSEPRVSVWAKKLIGANSGRGADQEDCAEEKPTVPSLPANGSRFGIPPERTPPA